jgi:hypothetical protein
MLVCELQRSASLVSSPQPQSAPPSCTGSAGRPTRRHPPSPTPRPPPDSDPAETALTVGVSQAVTAPSRAANAPVTPASTSPVPPTVAPESPVGSTRRRPRRGGVGGKRPEGAHACPRTAAPVSANSSCGVQTRLSPAVSRPGASASAKPGHCRLPSVATVPRRVSTCSGRIPTRRQPVVLCDDSRQLVDLSGPREYCLCA